MYSQWVRGSVVLCMCADAPFVVWFSFPLRRGTAKWMVPVVRLTVMPYMFAFPFVWALCDFPFKAHAAFFLSYTVKLFCHRSLMYPWPAVAVCGASGCPLLWRGCNCRGCCCFSLPSRGVCGLCVRD
ncbi:hypothetical protein DQ04_14521020 [Trypanosoma grayi]|uniref:hypothetical protein n=1 Tax=Trypanosoma grayi TaxID=71804 RepID=UPI0004F49BD6|nr:hypothetical protein DQ04_14521020 [Trypanosoma grayi]KEG06343.1 hypothetical protein DQ04_14521020 [Trypanosoma grayi]